MHNDSRLFRENLMDTDDFSQYYPILDPKEFPLDYFRSPEEPYLVMEMELDAKYLEKGKYLNRILRRSYIHQHEGDEKREYIYEQPDINNTHIMRGVQITVRDMDNKLITDKYGPAGGPFEDSRQTPGEIIWFRPHDYLHPSYVEGEENAPGYTPKYEHDAETFDFEVYPDKR